MAKKKDGQFPKVFPRPNQTWKDSSGKIEHRVFVERESKDADKTKTWDCVRSYNDPDKGEVKETCVLYLADFSESYMQLLVDPGANPTPQAPTTPKPEVSIIFSKKGTHLACPSPNCQQIRPMEDSMLKAEFDAVFQNFVDLHKPHYLKGTLWESEGE